MLTSYAKCACGAITFYGDTPGEQYSCPGRKKKVFFPNVDLRKLPRVGTYCNCNYCVNHWGLDLCGCGSGEPFGKCDAGLPECAHPSQKIGIIGPYLD